MTIFLISLAVLLAAFLGFAIGGAVGYDIRQKEEQWAREKSYLSDEEVGRLPK